MEVLVVDNASTDGSVEMIEAKFPWVKLIKSGEILGFAKGNNVAIRRCRGRYIALVNPDVIVFPGCLDALADFLDENPKVGNVGPRVLNPDMSMQSTCRQFPTLWNNFCSATGLSARFKNSDSLFAGEHMFYFPHDRTLIVDVIVGCFSMIRRETFDEVGLLDECLFMYGDDVDWCRRARNAGWQVVFPPGWTGHPRSRQNHGSVSVQLCSRATAVGPSLLVQTSWFWGRTWDPEHYGVTPSSSLHVVMDRA